jgi:hypothetical protein
MTTQIPQNEDFDVVLDALQERYDALERMDRSELCYGIMTQIRFEQRFDLKKAMDSWRKYKWEITSGTKDS